MQGVMNIGNTDSTMQNKSFQNENKRVWQSNEMNEIMEPFFSNRYRYVGVDTPFLNETERQSR